MSTYTAKITWKSDSPEAYAKNQYIRGHTWEFDGGITVPASSSSHAVRLPYSVEKAVDPEEALVASVSSCHMLTFLYLAARAGFNIASYEDNAVGEMAKTAEGKEWIAKITLALGLSAFASEMAAFEAGRIMLKRLRELAAGKKDFAFETTLATRSYERWIKNLQSHGYRFQLVYLWLKTPDLAVARVRARVRMGGHDIPEETIRRRYERGRRNFFEIYQPLADAWRVYDASPIQPQMVVYGDRISGTTVVEEGIWKKINE